MFEVILRLDVDALDADRFVRPVFEAISDFEAFEPLDYDLNQKEQWRDFDLERAIVDALTQRTQLVRLRGSDRGSMAMIAMGKHGEEPTVVLRLDEELEPVEIVEGWPALFEKLPIKTAILTSPSWRNAIASAGIDWSDDSIPEAIACGWPEGREPVRVSELAEKPADETPISAEDRDGSTILMLAPKGRIEDPAHRDALSDLLRSYSP